MATSPRSLDWPLDVPPQIHSSCDLVHTLIKLQRAAQLITSTLELDTLLDRAVNDLAAAIGCVEVSVWLRDGKSSDMVIRGCPDSQPLT
jgi:sigma-B regulation protein RsbU (phosphoserine phosphatase)